MSSSDADEPNWVIEQSSAQKEHNGQTVRRADFDLMQPGDEFINFLHFCIFVSNCMRVCLYFVGFSLLVAVYR